MLLFFLSFKFWIRIGSVNDHAIETGYVDGKIDKQQILDRDSCHCLLDLVLLSLDHCLSNRRSIISTG